MTTTEGSAKVVIKSKETIDFCEEILERGGSLHRDSVLALITRIRQLDAQLNAKDDAAFNEAKEKSNKAVRDYFALAISRKWILDLNKASQHIQSAISQLKR